MDVVSVTDKSRLELDMEFIGMTTIHGKSTILIIDKLYREYFHRNRSERLQGDQTNQRAELTV